MQSLFSSLGGFGAGGERRKAARHPEPGLAKLLSVGVDDEVRTHWVRLRDLSEGGFGIITDYKLPVGDLVWLQPENGEMVKAAVRYSRHQCGLEWRSGLFVLRKEGRRFGRDKVRGSAFLSWTCPQSGVRRTTAATVCDLSDGGAGVLIELEPPVGVLALLLGETLSCSCVVRYARLTGQGYRVGLLFSGRRSDRLREAEGEWRD